MTSEMDKLSMAMSDLAPASTESRTHISELAKTTNETRTQMSELAKSQAESRHHMGRMETRLDAIADIITKKLNPNSASYIGIHSEDEGDEGDSKPTKNAYPDDKGLKLDDYTGEGKPKDLLEWIRQLEKLEGLQQRAKKNKTKLCSWEKLNGRLKDKFLPDDYEQRQFIKLTSISQSDLSVHEYTMEFEKLGLICDIEEKEKHKTARYIKGLNRNIARRVEVSTYHSFEDVTKLAMKFEEHDKEEKPKGIYTPRYDPNTKGKATTSYTRWSEGPKTNTTPKEDTTMEKTKVVVPKEKFEELRKCFKCQGRGHIASNCPTKKALTMRQYLALQEEESMYEFIPEEEQSMGEDDEEEDAFAEDDSRILGVVRRTLHVDHTPNMAQRENLFHTRCKVGEYTCNVIIDSGSCTNVIAAEVVSKLNLITRAHPKPYKLSWLDDSTGMRVKKQALISFSIGSYKDELWCDILPMSACHLLLGRPWQFDRKVIHEGDTNVYSVLVGSKRVRLHPLNPTQVAPKQQPKTPSYFLNAKEFEHEVEKRYAYALV
ncbi:uncharacterized protein LOC130591394 [Beta vulgaris subsp. vulgaris]|uniref:uncharacterized protein LOC130591394 n=1 Tax=Beta vulgaris subsp. vulgaris TaxID=3555 RepID=UPI0025491458|nr:uncharacterized protein LOC130591394 [Beta vulgaris subsp. vulgaris]